MLRLRVYLVSACYPRLIYSHVGWARLVDNLVYYANPFRHVGGLLVNTPIGRYRSRYGVCGYDTKITSSPKIRMRPPFAEIPHRYNRKWFINNLNVRISTTIHKYHTRLRAICVTALSIKSMARRPRRQNLQYIARILLKVCNYVDRTQPWFTPSRSNNYLLCNDSLDEREHVGTYV